MIINVGGHHEYRRGVQYCGGTQITKYCIPHGVEYPTALKKSPHGTHDIPLPPHGIEHTLYRVVTGYVQYLETYANMIRPDKFNSILVNGLFYPW